MNAHTNTEEAIKQFAAGKLGNIKVLMIEDDSFFSELVLSKLSKEGCIPYSSANGEEALDLAQQYQPNIIILDLMLPGMQGESVLEQLKTNADLSHIPVVIFSNKSNQEDMDKNIKSGAAAFLIKSTTDLNELVDIVSGVIKKSKDSSAQA